MIKDEHIFSIKLIKTFMSTGIAKSTTRLEHNDQFSQKKSGGWIVTYAMNDIPIRRLEGSLPFMETSSAWRIF